MNRRILLFAFSAAALLLAGCATSTTNLAPVVLKATGEPGVTVQVTSTQSGVPQKVVNVPAELTFHGDSFDLDCMHGLQPGRLSLMVIRGGISISTGDTTQPGQATQFNIRQNSLSVGVPTKPVVK